MLSPNCLTGNASKYVHHAYMLLLKRKETLTCHLGGSRMRPALKNLTYFKEKILCLIDISHHLKIKHQCAWINSFSVHTASNIFHISSSDFELYIKRREMENRKAKLSLPILPNGKCKDQTLDQVKPTKSPDCTFILNGQQPSVPRSRFCFFLQTPHLILGHK